MTEIKLHGVLLKVEQAGGCYIEQDVTHRVPLTVKRFAAILKTIYDIGKQEDADDPLDEEGVMLVFMAMTKNVVRKHMEDDR